jgi:hypothetical protein
MWVACEGREKQLFQLNLHYLLLRYNLFHVFDHAQKLHVSKSTIKTEGL